MTSEGRYTAWFKDFDEGRLDCNCEVNLALKDEITSSYKSGTLPELFVERVRKRRSADVGTKFRAKVCRLHNDGTIDGLVAARSIETATINQHDFFTVMMVYCDLLPALNAEVSDMLNAVKALVARAGNDGAAGMPNGAFREWAEQGERAKAVLAAIDTDDPEDSAYIYLALQALAKSDPGEALARAIAHLADVQPATRSAATKAIGTMELASAKSLEEAGKALTAAAIASDDNTLGHVMTAACEIARAHPHMEDWACQVLKSSEPNASEHALHQLSLELMFHGEELLPSLVANATTILQKVELKNSATISNIGSAARKLVDHGRLDEAMTLVTKMIAKHRELASLEAFDGFASSLRKLDSEQLANVILDWLGSLDPNLGQATMSLTAGHYGKSPLILTAAEATLARPDDELLLLAHRAIGYLFLHPITAASLVLSLMHGVGDKAAEAMQDILFDPLLINFSGELADWLKEGATDEVDPVQPAIIDLLARLDEYIEGLRAAGEIEELSPSERERMIEGHRQHESMRQSHKEAEKKSVLLSIVSRSVLLYGTRSISKFVGMDGEEQRNEMPLHSFHHSFETPRLDILEPFDLDYTLRVFRAMRSVTL